MPLKLEAWLITDWMLPNCPTLLEEACLTHKTLPDYSGQCTTWSCAHTRMIQRNAMCDIVQHNWDFSVQLGHIPVVRPARDTGCALLAPVSLSTPVILLDSAAVGKMWITASVPKVKDRAPHLWSLKPTSMRLCSFGRRFRVGSDRPV